MNNDLDIMKGAEALLNTDANGPLNSLPAGVGIGLKPQHYSDILSDDSNVPKPEWVEVHPQNYFGMHGRAGGGPPHRWLTAIAEHYPISFHSVGLSLGSADGLNAAELEQIALLLDRYGGASFSDHLSWSGNAHDRYADLLPIPYTKAALDHFVTQIDRVQSRLKRPMLIENPSRYLGYAGDEMDEVEFLHTLCRKAGCGLLLDVNNIEVSVSNMAHNGHDGDPGMMAPEAYLDAIDPLLVGEMHLAGHATEEHESGPLKIDDHGSPVNNYCWQLYQRFIERAGPKPTLIEWDTDIPDYAVLMQEAQKAEHLMASVAKKPSMLEMV